MSSPPKKVKRDSQGVYHSDFVNSVIEGLEKDWKWFVRLLGATDSEIEICVRNNIGDVKEQAYQVMYQYIYEKYPKISWIDIKKALGFLKKNELIKLIKEKYQWVRSLDEDISDGVDHQWIRTLNEDTSEDVNYPEFVYSLTSELEKDWKCFVRLLGATDSEIETSVMENIESYGEQSYKVMQHIFQKHPETSWIDIKKALSFLQKNELIESIKEKYQWVRALDEKTPEDATYQYANATEFMLIIVSKHIVSNWQEVSKALQLPFYEGENIIHDNKESREQAYQALRSIKQRNKTLQWSVINSALKKINVKTNVPKSIEEELKQYGLLEKSTYLEKENCIRAVKIKNHGFSILSNASEHDLISIMNILKELDPLSKLPNYIMIHRGGGVDEILAPEEWFGEGHSYYDKFFSKDDYFTLIDDSDDSLFFGIQTFIKARKPGFIIHGYDILEHFHFLNLSLDKLPFINYRNIDFNRQYIAYEQENNALYFIHVSQGDTVEEIQNDINTCVTSIQMFILLHKALLFNSAICIVPLVVVKDSLKQLIDKSSEICDNCRTFVLTHNEFQSFDSLVQQSIGLQIEKSNGSMRRMNRNVRPYEKFKHDVGHILAFMAKEDSDLIPNLTNEVNEQIDQYGKRLTSMLLLSPQQLAVKNVNAKHLLIEGSYGSGKSIIGRIKLKQLANDPTTECIYYINYGCSKLFTKIMKDYVHELDQTNIFCYNRSETECLSEILQHIVNENHDKSSLNVIVEELKVHTLSKSETLKVIDLLNNSKLRRGNVLFICQSMISESVPHLNNIKQRFLFSDQVNLFAQNTSMTVKTLNDTARTTVNIDLLANSAIKVLGKESNRYSLGFNKIEADKSNGLLLNIIDFMEIFEYLFKVVGEEAAAIKDKELEELFLDVDTITKTLESDEFYLDVLEELRNDSCSNVQRRALETCSSLLKSINRDIFQDFLADTNHIISNFDKLISGLNTVDSDSLRYFSPFNPRNEDVIFLETHIKYQNSLAMLHNIVGSKPKVFVAHVKTGQGNILQSLLFTFFKKLYAGFVSSYEEVMVIHFENNVPEVIPATVKLFSDKTLNKVEKRFCYENVLNVRGMEYKNVIIYMNLNEYNMRHCLIDAMTRCKSNLFFFVVKEADPSQTTNSSLGEIIQNWQNNNLVECFTNIHLDWQKEENEQRLSTMLDNLSIMEDPLD